MIFTMTAGNVETVEMVNCFGCINLVKTDTHKMLLYFYACCYNASVWCYLDVGLWLASWHTWPMSIAHTTERDTAYTNVFVMCLLRCQIHTLTSYVVQYSCLFHLHETCITSVAWETWLFIFKYVFKIWVILKLSVRDLCVLCFTESSVVLNLWMVMFVKFFWSGSRR